MESLTQFESRKQDHLRLALDPQVQTGGNGLDRIDLVHEALPDLNFEEVDLSTRFGNTNLSSPIFISSMTAGHDEGVLMNRALAKLSEGRKILMGVGSQRRELQDRTARDEWARIRQAAPGALLIGNLGLAQVIQTPITIIQELVDSLGALALFVHLNSLQEALQPEGTPQFKGGLEKISELAVKLSVPVIVKEVGCGFSVSTLQRFEKSGIYAVDISGLGGTHWGRIEGLRAESHSLLARTSQTFSDWGISTLDSMMNARQANVSYQIWASGGVRNGLEAAKLLSLGAEFVGLAQPWLVACREVPSRPEEGLEKLAQQLEYELKTALFCTGCRNSKELREKRVWKWRTKN